MPSFPSLDRVAVLLSLAAGVCHAGRPLVVDDADPIRPGQWQVEAGASFTKYAGIQHGDVPLTLSYGVAPNLEIGAGSGAAMEYRQGENGNETVGSLDDVVLGAKWRLWQDEAQGVSFALAPMAKLPAADESHGLGTGSTDFGMAMLLTKGFGQTYVDLNVGYSLTDSFGGQGNNFWEYGAAVRHELNPALWVVGEVFAVSPVDAESTFVEMDVGVQWVVAPGLVLDAAVGTGVFNGPDLLATVGFTWVF